MPMTWTRTKPSVPGWYWWREEEDYELSVVHVYHLGDGSPLYVEAYGWLDGMPDGEWSSEAMEVPVNKE